jgi:hypothetical protein
MCPKTCCTSNRNSRDYNTDFCLLVGESRNRKKSAVSKNTGNDNTKPSHRTTEFLLSLSLLAMLSGFLLPILLLASAVGCTRTIYVPHGTPVRLRETVKDVKVWVKDADGQPVAGKMDLYEGWYSLPMPKEE